MEYFLITLTFLFTWPGILLTIALAFVPWMYIFAIVHPRRLEPLRNHFKGTVTWWKVMGGDLLTFIYNGRNFTLRSQSTGGVDATRARVTYFLTTPVVSQPAFYLGHERLTDYFFRFNLGSGQLQEFPAVDNHIYQIGSDDASTINRLRESLARSPELGADLALLFSEPWSHLKVKSTYHVGVGQQFEATYFGLPQDKVFAPAVVEAYTKALDRVLLEFLIS